MKNDLDTFLSESTQNLRLCNVFWLFSQNLLAFLIITDFRVKKLAESKSHDYENPLLVGLANAAVYRYRTVTHRPGDVYPRNTSYCNAVTCYRQTCLCLLMRFGCSKMVCMCAIQARLSLTETNSLSQ